MATRSRLLLAINCQLDASYANRHILTDLYGGRFPDIVFVVGNTCRIDESFPTVVISQSPGTSVPCACATARAAPHPAEIHFLHPRLVAVSAISQAYEGVLFVEDDCLLSPHITAEELATDLETCDAVTAPLRPCFPDDEWLWAGHGCGYPAFLPVADQFHTERVARNWGELNSHCRSLAAMSPLAGGMSDWLLLRSKLLLDIADLLELLRSVWHEIAIPSSLLHETSHIRRAEGIFLWEDFRRMSFERAMSLLASFDFVHPIKLGAISGPIVAREYARVASMRPSRSHGTGLVPALSRSELRRYARADGGKLKLGGSFGGFDLWLTLVRSVDGIRVAQSAYTCTCNRLAPFLHATSKLVVGAELSEIRRIRALDIAWSLGVGRPENEIAEPVILALNEALRDVG